MTKPLDLTKYRSSLTKSIAGISSGFNDPKFWISTGNYTLNYLLSGDFQQGIPLGKFTVFAGESGSGKSYICSGNITKNAQKMGAQVVLLDSENALDEQWLIDLGVDTDPQRLMRIGVSKVDDVAKTLSEFLKQYKDTYGGYDYMDQPPLLFVIDSLGMLTTPTDEDQFAKGDMKGDMGRKAKQLGALVRNTVNLIANHPVGIVATNHTYASQDMFDPDDKISGGNGPIFASSIVVAMRKLKLKEDENGGKVTDVTGIRAVCKVVKTRYSKPFESVEIKIPYSTGMDPYSGLFEFFEKLGLITKDGNRHKYVSKTTGEEFKEYKKNWPRRYEVLDLIMKELDDNSLKVQVTDADLEE